MRLHRLAAAGLAFAVALAAAPAAAESESTVRLGISNYATPNANEALYRETIETIRKAVAPKTLVVKQYSPGRLDQYVATDELDLLFGSSGFYRRNAARTGFRELASIASDAYPDPNHTDGSAIVVSESRADLRQASDLKGLRLSVNAPYTFTGYFVPMGVIARTGADPFSFFGLTLFKGEGSTMELVAKDVIEGRADAGFLRLCMLETLEASGKIPKGALRVLEPQEAAGEPCRRSTPLIPGWTVSTTPRASAELARRVTLALLSQPSVGKGLHWAVASNYQAVDALYKDLRIGPYEYLRHWSLQRFVERYWAWIFSGFLFTAALAAVAWHYAGKARRQSRELQIAFEREQELARASREAAERISALQKVQAVGQLSSMIAHELRQPLTSIRALSRGLLRFMENGRCTEQMTKENLEIISEQAKRADTVIERVRSYAKTPNAPRAPVDLARIARKAADDVTLGARIPQNIFSLKLAPVQVSGNADELLIAIENLLKNSLDATASIPGPRIELEVKVENGLAAVAIRDNGPAISDEMFAALATPLKSSKAGGLGLGLAIVQTIAESHSGRVAFRRLAPGLEVTVMIPCLKVKDA